MKTVRLSEQADLQTFLPDFYNSISYDGSPEFADFIPTGVWMTLCEDIEVAGFINLQPMNNVTWIAHVMIYEKFRGNNSEEWGNQVAEYMKQNLGAKKFLAITPYESAKKYAQRMGFTYVAMLKQSIRKNGMLLDQHMMEK